jgi:hypothetical protein
VLRGSRSGAAPELQAHAQARALGTWFASRGRPDDLFIRTGVCGAIQLYSRVQRTVYTAALTSIQHTAAQTNSPIRRSSDHRHPTDIHLNAWSKAQSWRLPRHFTAVRNHPVVARSTLGHSELAGGGSVVPLRRQYEFASSRPALAMTAFSLAAQYALAACASAKICLGGRPYLWPGASASGSCAEAEAAEAEHNVQVSRRAKY